MVRVFKPGRKPIRTSLLFGTAAAIVLFLFEYFYVFLDSSYTTATYYHIILYGLSNTFTLWLFLLLPLLVLGETLTYLLPGLRRRQTVPPAVYLSVVFLWSGYFYTLLKFRYFFGKPDSNPSLIMLASTLVLTASLVVLGWDRAGKSYLTGPHGKRLFLGLLAVIVLLPVLQVSVIAPPSDPVPTTSSVPSSKQAPHVFLLVVDTLHAGHLNLHGYERHRTSPNLAEFAADATVFESARSPSPWTLPSIVSLHTGLTPQTHNVLTEERQLPDRVETLAERLRTAGYQTGAVSAQHYFSPRWGLDQGYEFFVTDFYNEVLRNGQVIRILHKLNQFLPTLTPGWLEVLDHQWMADADDLHASTKSLLRNRIERDRPIFMTVHYMDPHSDYHPPKYLLETQKTLSYEPYWAFSETIKPTHPEPYPFGEDVRATDAIRSERIYRYDSEIRYWDHEFAQFLSSLKDMGLYENSMIVVVSDHGEEFYQHGHWTHGTSVFSEQLHVPFLIKFPRNEFDRRIHRPVTITDLPTTLLDYLFEDHEPFEQSHSLMPLVTSDPQSPGDSPASGTAVVSILFDEKENEFSRTLVQGEWAYLQVRGPAEKRRELLFNLKRDPRQKRDLAERHPDQLRTLSRRSNRLHDRWRDQKLPKNRLDVTSDLGRRLKGLGYLK